MPNLAIVISVSDYINETPLPACEKDGQALAQLVRATGRFDDVLHLSQPADTDGAVVKERLSEFADKYRGSAIGELLFYFSGHGEFSGDELFLLLRDFSDRQRKQTSLLNSELDGIIRALGPKLYVKIIDACESGVGYIKSREEMNDYLKASSSGLTNLYFMFSSQSDQSSYASRDISYFTESLLNSVISHKANTLRYKDIINSISDDFAATSRQTPFFVMQANMTEPFADLTPALRAAASSALGRAAPATPTLTPAPAKVKAPTLEERIREAEKDIATRAEALKALNHIAEQLKDAPLSDETKSLYKEVQEHREQQPATTSSIGEWLENNPDRSFFAFPKKKSEQYQKRVPKNSIFSTAVLSRIMTGRDSEEDYRTITATRQVIVGYETTAEMPFDHIIIRLNPTAKILTPEECSILPIVSRTHVRLFWSFVKFEYSDWELAVPRSRSDWYSDEAMLKDQSALDALASRIMTAFARNVDSALSARWKPPIKLDLTKSEPPPPQKK